MKAFRTRSRNDYYTQRLFNRLMFIAFIQKKGWLKFDSKTDYLSSLWHDYLKRKDHGDSFYRDRLKVLFFAGLNNSSNVNIVGINSKGVLNNLIGDVPYLNGGLFEEETDDRAPRSPFLTSVSTRFWRSCLEHSISR